METEDHGAGWRIILMSIFCNIRVAIGHFPQFKFIYTFSIEFFLQCFGNAFVRWQFVIGQKEKLSINVVNIFIVTRLRILGDVTTFFTCLHVKSPTAQQTHYIPVLKTSHLMLYRELIGVLIPTENIQIHSVGRTYNFFMVDLVVHQVTTRLWRIKLNTFVYDDTECSFEL
jgi:hypothetical protein